MRLLGFVSSEPRGERPFELSRFYITWCVADAVPVGVHVTRGVVRRLRAEHDDWLDECSARQWIVRAVRVRHVQAPSNPYLSFAS